MKRRMLILLALVAGFVDMSYAQSPPLNCTHGSWQIAGEPYKDNGCNNSVTDQRYRQRTMHHHQRSIQPRSNLLDIPIFGYRNRTTLLQRRRFSESGHRLCLQPVHEYVRSRCGLQNPDGTYSASDYNRFYNQEFDMYYSGPDYSSNPCAALGPSLWR